MIFGIILMAADAADAVAHHGAASPGGPSFAVNSPDLEARDAEGEEGQRG